MSLHSQLYLTGRLAGPPELGTTKKGKLWVKLLLETELVRQTQPGDFQTESVTVPISFFSRPAEQVKNLARGAALTVGAHLYGTKFESDQGIKYGVQLIGDVVFTNSKGDHP
jgi:single-stranded DNA-binding protein